MGTNTNLDFTIKFWKTILVLKMECRNYFFFLLYFDLKHDP
ncbi:hypothetical protein LEP1GSC170_3451 [Leptospira interrogans serovar Bataviae str. HAI135]|nr:hypothetical protein LEP1GSC170_3451 [Leptospira interrogans serovar Bataviae str. HAI135]